MTAQQYLLSQAEHCRRTAEQAVDPYVAEELRRLAETFERNARGGKPRPAAELTTAA